MLGPPCWETAPRIRAPVLTPPVGVKQSQVNEADRRVCSQSFIYSRAVLYRITEFTWSGALLFIFVLKKKKSQVADKAQVTLAGCFCSLAYSRFGGCVLLCSPFLAWKQAMI